jgi:hypothetical protein
MISLPFACNGSESQNKALVLLFWGFLAGSYRVMSVMKYANEMNDLDLSYKAL